MDKKRIAGKIAEMDSYITELEAIAPDKLEYYLEDERTKRACERLLQISVETVIDISALVLKGIKSTVPSDEEDVFDKLSKNGIITEKFLGKLKTMKGFRNILVHRYGEVNDRLVFSYLQNDLEDFSEFRRQVLKFLKKRS